MVDAGPVGAVLIDTTLQIEQQKIDPRPSAVESMLAPFRFRGASSFSRLEAKRAWIQRLAYIHTESKQVGSIPQLMDRITRKLGSRPENHRKLTSSIEAISSLSERLGGTLSGNAAMERFRYFIVDAVLSLNVWWDRSIHYEFDGTKCVRARERPSFDTKTETIKAAIARCVPAKIQCTIHTFRRENDSHFQKIVDAVRECKHETEKSAELQRSAQLLKESSDDPECLCDDRVCGRIGDSIITVDGIRMSHYASTNSREWAPLAKIFDKQFVNPFEGGSGL
jgi:hypothetical protein